VHFRFRIFLFGWLGLLLQSGVGATAADDSQALARQQALGQPTAHEGKYHAQFHFSGRLRQPLIQLGAGEIPNWLEAHPNGVAVIYFDDRSDFTPYQPLAVQAFRGSFALLIDHRAVAALRKKPLKSPPESPGE